MSTVSVNVSGKEYRISCSPEEKENVREAASYLDNKMQELKRAAKTNIAFDRLVIVAAINITYELLQKQHAIENNMRQSEEQVKEILDKVSKALEE